jgi:hypothetical protein
MALCNAPRDASAFRATPPCSGSAGLMGQPRWSSPGHNRTHIGVCMQDTHRRAALARILLDGSATLDAAPAAIGHGAAIRPADLRVFLALVMLVLHPCQQAASHLPCTRPPDRLLPGRPRDSLRGSRRGSHYRAAQRAFVTTRSGTDTMARRRRETDDEITVTDDSAGAATFGGAPIRGPRQKFSSCPPSQVHRSRTSSSLVASRRASL